MAQIDPRPLVSDQAAVEVAGSRAPIDPTRAARDHDESRTVDAAPECRVDGMTPRGIACRLQLIRHSLLEQIDVLSVSTFAPDAQRAVWARQILDTWGSAHHRNWSLFRGHLFEQVWHDRYNATHVRSKAWMAPKSNWEGYDVVTTKWGVKPIWVGKGEPIPATCTPNHVVIVEGQPTPAGVTAHSLKAYHDGSPLLERAQGLAADKVGGGDKVVTTRGTRRSADPKVVEDPSIGDGYLKRVAGNANGDRGNPSVDEAVVAAPSAASLRGLMARASGLAALAAGGWQLLIELHRLDESPSVEDLHAASRRIVGASATAAAGAAVGVGAAWWFTEAGGAAWAADLLGLAAGEAIPSWFAAAAASTAVFAVVLVPVEAWRVATHRSTLLESAGRLMIALGTFGLSVGALALGLPAWLPAVLLFGAVAVAYVIKHGPVEAARRTVHAVAKVVQRVGRVRDAAAPVVEPAVGNAMCKLKSAARWAKDHTEFVPLTIAVRVAFPVAVAVAVTLCGKSYGPIAYPATPWVSSTSS